MANLRETLARYDLKVLQAIAREMNLRLDAKSPKDAAHTLERYVGASETVQRALNRLRPAEREALARLQRAGGTASARGLKMSLLQSGHVAPTPKQRSSIWPGGPLMDEYEAKADYSGKPCFEDALARLTVLGLVFSEREPQHKNLLLGYSPGPILFIPEIVFRQLPAYSSATADITELEQTLAGSARQFQRDLGRYWRYVRRVGELRITTQGYIYKNDVKSITAALGKQDTRSEQDNPRLNFLRAHMADLKLLSRGEEWVTNPGPQSFAPVEQPKFWMLPAAERVRASFGAWRDGLHWNELIRIPIKHGGYDHRRPAPDQVLQARQAVLRQMAALGKGWISIKVLLDRVALANYEFLFPRHFGALSSAYYYSPVPASPYYGSNNPYALTFEGIKDEAEGWPKVEGGFVAALIAGPMYWMGLVDLGGTSELAPAEEALPIAYRLTDLGAWVLGLGSAPDIAEEGGRVVVQPNFQIMAMEPISDRVLGELDEFADTEGGDRALLYRLSRQSVYRGQQNGWNVPRIVARLEELCSSPLPANVRRSLDEWEALHNRIVIRRDATLLLASDTSVLDDLLADPQRAQVLRRVAAEIAVPTLDAAESANLLRQANWPPLITPRGQDDSAGSLRLDEEGRITYVHPTPSLGARSRLSFLVDDGRITPDTVTAAIKAGRNVDDILAHLRAAHTGELPPALVTQIKAWGRYYGDGAMSQVMLLQVRDKGVLKELCADPDLAPYLKPFEAGDRALALVDGQHADEVKALLAQRGVTVHGKID